MLSSATGRQRPRGPKVYEGLSRERIDVPLDDRAQLSGVRRPLYVVSQFASAVNRRLLHLLSLEARGFETVLVRQGGVSPERVLDHTRVELVFKQPNPIAALNWIGLRNLRRRIDGRIWFPTPTILYARAVLARLTTLFRRDFAAGFDPTVVLVTPPHDLVIIAPELRRRFPGLRLLIDWQDLWSDDEVYHSRTRKVVFDRLCSAERDAALAADVNVTTNPKAAERFAMIVARSGTGGRLPKVMSIGHAFDEEEAAAGCVAFQERGKHSGSPRLRLTFVGNLFKPPKVPGDDLIAALNIIYRSGCDFELSVIGDKTLERQLDRLRSAMFSTSVVPRLPHLEAMRLAAQADWLLLLLGRTAVNDAVNPSKLPMYLAIGVPVLAVAPTNSYVAEVIRSTQAGVVVDPDSDLPTELAFLLSRPPQRPASYATIAARAARFGVERQRGLWVSVIEGKG